MAQMTLTELTSLLRECAGEQEGVDLAGDVADVDFTDLGYDSLAVLQAAGIIERDHNIVLPDETVAEASTPGLLLEFVNASLSAGASS
ncbi:acyl carrier protein [Streptomyces sp. NPDC021093]|uniref:acyl carrier protein n=1 Tax=Streptomyces sp. NPDC021093 TaxID=3365112 RepID=UPI0037AAE47C